MKTKYCDGCEFNKGERCNLRMIELGRQKFGSPNSKHKGFERGHYMIYMKEFRVPKDCPYKLEILMDKQK